VLRRRRESARHSNEPEQRAGFCAVEVAVSSG
jgi:hypothetical protein